MHVRYLLTTYSFILIHYFHRRLCLDQSKKHGLIIETLTAVIDVKDMKLSLVTRDFLSLIKRIAQIDQQQYPETLGKIFIINTPSAFPYVWRVVKPFLDPAVAAKIFILSSKSEWQPVFLDQIGEENLPINYGGKVDELTDAVYPYAEAKSKYYPMTGFDDCGLNIEDESVGEDEETGGLTGNLDQRLDYLNQLDITKGNGVLGLQEKFDYLNTNRAVESSEVENSWNPFSRFANFLRHGTLQGLKQLMFNSIIFSLLVSFIALLVSSLCISSITWTTEFAKVQLWAGIVVLFLSALIILINLAGLVGYFSGNRQIMIVYGMAHVMATVVFLVVGIACVVYKTIPQVNGINSINALQKYDLALSITSILFAVCTVIPAIAAFSLSRRMGSLRASKISNIMEYRTLVKVVVSILLICGLVMITYATINVKFLHTVGVSSAFDSIFGLLYSGVTILLASALGIWCSNTNHLSILRVYYQAVLPCTIVILLLAASRSFGTFGSLSIDKAENILSLVQIQLLVTGIFCLYVAFFEVVVIYSIKILHAEVEKRKNHSELTTTYEEIQDFLSLHDIEQGNLLHSRTINNLLKNKRRIKPSTTDRLIIGYSLLMGLLYVYCVGTITVFSAFRKLWANNFYYIINTVMGSRLFVIMSSITSIVLGPLLFFYAGSIYVKASYRHTLGIVISTVQIYQQLTIILMFAQMGLGENHKNYTLAVTFLFVSSILHFTLPVVILFRDGVTTSRSTNFSDSYELYGDKLFQYKSNKERRKHSVAGSSGGSDSEVNTTNYTGSEVNSSITKLSILSPRVRGISQDSSGRERRISNNDSPAAYSKVVQRKSFISKSPSFSISTDPSVSSEFQI